MNCAGIKLGWHSQQVLLPTTAACCLHLKNKETGTYCPSLLSLDLPPPRIELGTEHYHCSIIPFNYSGYLSIIP